MAARSGINLFFILFVFCACSIASESNINLTIISESANNQNHPQPSDTGWIHDNHNDNNTLLSKNMFQIHNIDDSIPNFKVSDKNTRKIKNIHKKLNEFNNSFNSDDFRRIDNLSERLERNDRSVNSRKDKLIESNKSEEDDANYQLNAKRTLNYLLKTSSSNVEDNKNLDNLDKINKNSVNSIIVNIKNKNEIDNELKSNSVKSERHVNHGIVALSLSIDESSHNSNKIDESDLVGKLQRTYVHRNFLVNYMELNLPNKIENNNELQDSIIINKTNKTIINKFNENDNRHININRTINNSLKSTLNRTNNTKEINNTGIKNPNENNFNQKKIMTHQEQRHYRNNDSGSIKYESIEKYRKTDKVVLNSNNSNKLTNRTIKEFRIPNTYDIILEYKYRKKRKLKSWFRRRRQSPDDQEVCEPFTNHANHVFHHPGYPGNYSKKADCVTMIEANEGYVIKLDFRDEFHLEYHVNCSNDFLEVRDGPYGYSDLLGTFCGHKFPRMLISKGPHLWLRFKSDSTIEYSGFTAVYEFEENSASKKQPPSCVQEISGSYFGEIKSQEINESCTDAYKQDNLPLDTLWHIVVNNGWKIFLNFTTFSLAEPNECKHNFVDVFGEKTEIPKRLKNFCGSMADTVITETNELYLRYYVSPTAMDSKFTAQFTAFRKLDTDQSCEEDEEFDCDDATCIKFEYRCDGIANCRLKGDEDADMCKPATESILNSEHIIIILVIFTLILTIMVIVFLYKCFKKLIADHKIIKEQIRQSREDRLNSLTGSRVTLNPRQLQQQITQIHETRNSNTHLSRASSSDNQRNHERAHKTRRSINRDKSSSLERSLHREPTAPPSVERAWPLDGSDQSRTRSIEPCDTGVKENSCQTRESLFRTEPILISPMSADSGTTDEGSITTRSQSRSLSTFRPQTKSPPSAQVTIQIVPVNQHSPTLDKRPISNETTRSAPDVIIVSKPGV